MAFAWILLALAVLVWQRVFAGYPAGRAGHVVLAPREAAFLEAAADATFPAGGEIAPSGTEAGIPAYVDRYLAAVPPRMRRLMRLLFALIEHATLIFPAPGTGGRRRFSSLAPEQRVAALEGWAKSPLFPRRLVFASLRAILTMGYFGDPTVLRLLRLAPYAIDTPACDADLLYPRIGASRASIRLRPEDVKPRPPAGPIPLDAPLHPDYAADAR